MLTHGNVAHIMFQCKPLVFERLFFAVCCMLVAGCWLLFAVFRFQVWVWFLVLLEPALLGDEEEVVHNVLRRPRKLGAQHRILKSSQ
jgi:hypothetical protein